MLFGGFAQLFSENEVLLSGLGGAFFTQPGPTPVISRNLRWMSRNGPIRTFRRHGRDASLTRPHEKSLP